MLQSDRYNKFMKHLLKLASRGHRSVSPNPMVGAIIISPDLKAIAAGYHRKYGGAHAEIDALNIAQKRGLSVEGCTLLVNLEPCSHYGKTPPCVDAVIKSGIKRVVIATLDPNPKVNGNGVKRLLEAGVEVVQGVCAEEAMRLNRGYFAYRHWGRAWCAAKVALSADGKLADYNGVSKWITGEKARALAHKLRSEYDGVMVGGNTVKNDDPELTVRMVKGKNPIRIVISSDYGIPVESQLIRTVERAPILLIHQDGKAPNIIETKNVSTLSMEADANGNIDSLNILRELPQQGILSVLIEGGAGVLSSFMQAGLVDELFVGIAPSVIGKGISPFERFVPDGFENRPRYALKSVQRLDSDVVLSYVKEKQPFSQD